MELPSRFPYLAAAFEKKFALIVAPPTVQNGKSWLYCLLTSHKIYSYEHAST